MRHKIREADIRRKTRTNATYDFLRRVMTDRALRSSTESEPELTNDLIVPVKTPPSSPFL